MNIGRYEVLDEVGQGAMGTVYRPRDPLIERTVAIKTVPIDRLHKEGTDAEARFLREAQSAGRLSHPNIVTIYDVGETDGLAYIAMEYLSGPTLRQLIDHSRMPLELALDTARQMAEALAFAHAHGVIHRDIKPANVVVTGQRGQIKLTDFGIAHLANSEQTQAGQMLGSPRYMSPEQAMGREVDGRSDIFSLGAVLYEMLTGRYAFDGDSLATIVYRVIHDAPMDPAALRPNVPTGLVQLLGRMLNKSPDARPDAQAVVAALHALTTPVAAPAPPKADNRVPRLLKVLAFGTPLGVFLLIGLGIIVIEHFLGSPPAAQTPQPVPVHGAAESAAPETRESVGTSPRPPAPAPDAPRPATDPYLAGLDRKQVELRIRRTELLLSYTEQHPDVVQVDRQLDQLRAERRRYLRQLQRESNR
ncbi:MAG: protein kinase domain-containing protein [Gammaproteobacteria bacterium]